MRAILLTATFTGCSGSVGCHDTEPTDTLDTLDALDTWTPWMPHKLKNSPDRPLGPGKGLGDVSSAGEMEQRVETSFITSSCSVLSTVVSSIGGALVVGAEETEEVITGLEPCSMIRV